MTLTATAELARQVDAYVEMGYPDLAGLSEQRFRDLFAPLAVMVAGVRFAAATSDNIPFVAVVTRAVIAPEHRQVMTHLDGSNKPGVVDKNHGEEGLEPYEPITDVTLPKSPVYLLTDVERGNQYRGVAPKDALPAVLERGRTPLTIDEGISLVTLFPATLEKNKCFMLAGSRRGDKRVPAMWIADRAPKLGWCWDGNPHDWLGMASAAARS